MKFIILDLSGGPKKALVVTDEDGNNLIFETFQEAADFVFDNLQDARIIEVEG